jgi:hypothetical protein
MCYLVRPSDVTAARFDPASRLPVLPADVVDGARLEDRRLVANHVNMRQLFRRLRQVAAVHGQRDRRTFRVLGYSLNGHAKTMCLGSRNVESGSPHLSR